MSANRLTVALFQPDIPQNCGTILRLCACLDVPAAVIEPAGFPFSDKHLRRAGLDYLDAVTLERFVSFAAFDDARRAAHRRLVLLTTKATEPYAAHRFAGNDILLFGRESAGVPDAVHAAADIRLTVPMRPALRSLNVAVTVAMVLGEALRQLNGFPSALASGAPVS